ncbi:hypothetical protein O3G_MSEX010990 [Manduca sexta]|uniref:Uncharacterized protein n=1 Tax=Manduca sexta TaxID=7130 RepID=A0A922CUD4_MANSE|nr:hypothetical protein O3G_MSEX010990 [Manduca sexta]
MGILLICLPKLFRFKPGGCIVNGGRTPSYAAILDSKGECLLGLGDMELHNHITIDLVNKHIEVLKDAPLVVIDGNPPQETINHVLKLCHELQKPVFFEPTDRRKAIKAINEESTVTFTSPNLKELREWLTILNLIRK